MTSRRSPPPRLNGNSAALSALVAALAVLEPALLGPSAARAFAAPVAPARASGPLRETRAGVDVDWGEGQLTASGGAAADLRLPSADVARPGAVRRATAAARARLQAALAQFPLGGGRTLTSAAIARALGRARAQPPAYQSDGGALVRVSLRFADWIEPPSRARGDDSTSAAAPVAVLTTPAMHLAAAPLLRVAGRDVPLGAALYRVGEAPADAKALRAQVDGAGRLVVDGPLPADTQARLARGVAVIYVQKVLR
jgi:hypothetical protein